MKILLTTILITLTTCTLIAQGFHSNTAWRTKRVELTGGLGASNFLGELGGRNRIGSNFIWDLEFPATRYVAHITYLYYLQDKIAIRPSFHFARVAGNDALTQERFRQHRNLSFSSNLYEISVTGEYQFIKEKTGNIYDVKTSTGKRLAKSAGGLGLYATAGIGLVFYNPKAKGPNGVKVALRKLGTEGQGLPGGPKKYKPATIVIPVGLGIRKDIGRDIGLKLELAYRFTFSDYIDDVSTNYYDNAKIKAANGDIAAYVADPSIKNDGLNNTGDGLQRGNPKNNDGYLFLTLSFFKTIKTK